MKFKTMKASRARPFPDELSPGCRHPPGPVSVHSNAGPRVQNHEMHPRLKSCQFQLRVYFLATCVFPVRLYGEVSPNPMNADLANSYKLVGNTLLENEPFTSATP